MWIRHHYSVPVENSRLCQNATYKYFLTLVIVTKLSLQLLTMARKKFYVHSILDKARMLHHSITCISLASSITVELACFVGSLDLLPILAYF